MKSPRTSDVIAAEIAAQGPITLARFIELALYHPEAGYYGAGRAGIGRTGDFFTNVSVGPTFGRLLAGQFEEMWRNLGQPVEFTIVEQGANDGQLAADVFAAASGPFADAMRYIIIEPSTTLADRQRSTLATWIGQARWIADVENLPSFAGVHFSNELVDALPFHLMQARNGGWEELFVKEENGAFAFEAASPSLVAATEISLLPPRVDGTLAELRPAAAEWLRTLAARLTAGYILIVDYGYSRDVLLAEHRTNGTFSCYRNHKRDDKVLEDAGEKDITAHVDFTRLGEVASQAGLRIDGFTDQHRFIVGAAEALLRSLEGKTQNVDARKTLRAIQTLMHPESMGTQFRYLGLSRNVASEAPPSGFKHARNTSTELFAKPDPVV